MKRLARAVPLAVLVLACLASAVRAACPDSFSNTFSNGKTWTIAYVAGSYNYDAGTDQTTICYDLSSPNGGTEISHFVLGACPDLQKALDRVRYSSDGGATFSDVTSFNTGTQTDPTTGVQGIKIEDGPAGRYCFIFDGCWRFSEDVENLPMDECPVVGLKDASDVNVRGPIKGLLCEACPSQPPLEITCPTVSDVCSTHKENGVPGANVSFDDPLTSGGVPPVDVVCATNSGNVQSGAFFPEGTTTVTCTATDATGATASCTFTVTVDKSTKLDVDGEAIPGQTATICATLTDLCDNPIVGETVDFEVSANNTTYTGSGVTDVNGKATMDNPPVIMQVGGTTITVKATYGGQTPVEGQSEYCAAETEEEIEVSTNFIALTCPTVADVCSTHKENGVPGANVNFDDPVPSGGVGQITIVCKDQNGNTVQSGDFFPEGTTTITCTATDELGQTEECTFTITVDKSTQLSITALAQYSDPALIQATLTDLCGNPIAGADIDFEVMANSQTYNGTGTTDANGVAEMPNPPVITQAASTSFHVKATYAGETPVEGQSEYCGTEAEDDPAVECEDAILSNLRCEPSVKSGGNLTVNLLVDVAEFNDGSPGDLTVGDTVVDWTLCTLGGQQVTSGSSPIVTGMDPSQGTATIQFTVPCDLYIIKIQVGGSYYCSDVLDADPYDGFTGMPVDADPPKGIVLSSNGTGTAENTSYSVAAYATKVATVQICDNTTNPTLLGSGLCKITVVKASNCLIFFDHPGGNFDGAQGFGVGGCYFPAAGTGVVIVSAIRIDPNKSASFLLTGEDCFCNKNNVDPVTDTLTLGRNGKANAIYSRRKSGDAIFEADTYFLLKNNGAAPMRVQIQVNGGWRTDVVVPAGSTVTGTLSNLREGEDNRVHVSVLRGPAGATLDLAIADVPLGP